MKIELAQRKIISVVLNERMNVESDFINHS